MLVIYKPEIPIMSDQIYLLGRYFIKKSKYLPITVLARKIDIKNSFNDMLSNKGTVGSQISYLLSL